MKSIPHLFKQLASSFWKAILLLFACALSAQLGAAPQAEPTFSEIKKLFPHLRNSQLKRLIKLCSSPKGKSKHYMKALPLAFLEKERALPLVKYLLTRAKKRAKELDEDFLMRKALEHASLQVVDYLLQRKVYHRKMLQGKKKHSFRGLTHIFWPRFISSINQEPYWSQFITTYIMPVRLLSLVSIVRFFCWLTGVKIEGKFASQVFKVIGWINFVSVALKAIWRIGNAYYILYIAQRLYEPSYLTLVIRGYRSAQEKKELVQLLLAYGANPLAHAFFIKVKIKASQESGVTIYRFEEKGAIHFAIEENLIEVVHILYQANPKVLRQAAYILEDPTPTAPKEEVPFFAQKGASPAFISIQTIYTKKGDKKVMPQIKKLLPLELAREGSQIQQLLLEKLE